MAKNCLTVRTIVQT